MRFILLGIIIYTYSLCAAPGFFETDNWKPRTSPSLPTAVENPIVTGAVDVQTTINFSDTTAKVLASLFGNNIASYGGPLLYSNYNADNPSLNVLSDTAMTNLKAANISYLRLPGGNYTSKWMWNEASPDTLFSGGVLDLYQDSLQGHPSKRYWQLSTDNMLEIIDTIGAIAQPCVNYSLARYINNPDRVALAAGYAADWVRDLDARNIAAPYWEVGNEHYGKWQAGYAIPGRDTLSGTEYGKDFCVYVDSMKAANPDIKIGAVLFPDDSGYDNWSALVLPEIQDKADFVIIHEYFTYDATDMNNITVQEVLDGLQKHQENRISVENMITSYTNKTPNELPIMLSEFNVRAGVKEMAMVSTAFITRSLNELTQEKYGLVNIWNIANGYNASKGDHGMFARKEPSVPDNTPHASFFAYYYSSRFMGDVMVGAVNDSSADGHLTTYATRFSDGAAGIIIVNTGTTTQNVELTLNGITPKDNLYWYEVTADDGLDFTIDVNGVTSSLTTGGPEDYAAVAPYSDIASTTQFFVAKPWSCNFILIPADDPTPLGTKPSIQKSSFQFINNSLHLPVNHSIQKAIILDARGRVINTLSIAESAQSISLGSSSHLVRFIKLYSKQGFVTIKVL